MEITLNMLTKFGACFEALEWFKNQNETNDLKLLKKAKKENHVDWINWLAIRLMNKKQKVEFAIFTAELVLDIYEKKYPNDNKPRKAIDAAKNYLLNPSRKNINDAADAANAASAAAYSAYSAASATYDAAYAAAAAAAASAAAYSAAAAASAASADAASNAAYASYNAANKNKKKIQTKIINKAIELLKIK